MSREYRKIDVTGGILTGEELYTLAYIRAALRPDGDDIGPQDAGPER